MEINSINDLPDNKEVWDTNESQTCANVYKRNGNKVTWYTFYKYGTASKVRTWSADKFNNWLYSVNLEGGN